MREEAVRERLEMNTGNNGMQLRSGDGDADGGKIGATVDCLVQKGVLSCSDEKA